MKALAYNTIICSLIVAVSIASFYNGFLNDFAFDDYLAIVNNKDTLPETPYSNILNNDIWGKDLQAEDSHRSWRPLLILFFKFVRTNFEFKAHIFRAFSIAFHSIAALLVYALSTKIIGDAHLAAGASLLFAAHPVHVESVTAVVNIAESMSCITYIISYLIFLRFYDGISSDVDSKSDSDDDNDNGISGSNKNSNNIVKSLLKALLWLVFVFTGILLKESGVTISAMIVAKIGIDAFSWAGRKCAHQSRTKKNVSAGKTIISFLVYVFQYIFSHKFWICMSIIVILMYLTLRDLVITKSIPTVEFLGIKFPKVGLNNSYLNNSQLLRKAENPFAELLGLEKAMSLMYLHFRYFWVMLWPVELSPEYAFDCIPKVTSVIDPNFKTAAIYYGAFVFLIVFGIFLIIKQSSTQNTDLTSTTKTAIAAATTAVKTDSNNNNNNHDDNISSSIDSNKLDVVGNNNNADAASKETPSLDKVAKVKESGTVNISRSALITTMAWFVVTFVPASGVFLKLGTLLAERLLYIPSIAFCIILSIFIYAVCRSLAWLIRLKEPRSIHVFGVSLYWIIIIVATALYAQRANEYNLSWKNDEVLFVDSLKVCPRSAKLQMQVAKLRVNEGNFSAAAQHIKIARSIDPDFCDIGYQDALMSLFYYNNMEDAMEHLAKNLECIYSNKQSWDLLQKLMEQQLSPNRQDIKVIEYHADLLSSHKMIPLAAKKYQEAATYAYITKQYAKALNLNKKAYDLTPKFFDDLKNPIESASNGVADAICSIYAAGGTWQTEIKAMNPRPKGITKAYLNKTSEFLLKALSPFCVVVDSSVMKVVSNHPMTAMATVTGILNGNADSNNATTLFENALLAEKSASIIMKIDMVSSLSISNNTSVKYTSSISPSGWNKQGFEFIVVARQLFTSAGKLEFKKGDYVLAADRFKRALAYEYNIEGTLVQEPIEILYNHSVVMNVWWGTVKKLYSDMLPFDPSRDNGYLLYWYIHSLAAKPGFLENQVQIGEVVGSYKAILERQRSANLPANQHRGILAMYEAVEDELDYLKEFCAKHEGVCPEI